MFKPSKMDLVNSERTLADFVPYSVHSSPFNMRTDRGDTLTVFKIAGVSHEAADDEDLLVWHDSLAGMVKGIGNGNIAFWSHTARRKRSEFPGGEFANNFAGRLNSKYRQHLAGADMMVNEHYLTMVLRKPRGLAGWLGGNNKKTVVALREAVDDANEVLDDLSDTVLASMQRYNTRRLGVYEQNGVLYSEAAEFLGFLVNGEWQPEPLTKGRIAYSMTTSRVSFGDEQFEIRTPEARMVGKLLGVTEYRTETTQTGHMNGLLTLPFEFVLSQSFACIDRLKAQDALKKQRKLLENADDAAVSQIEAIRVAEDDVASNRIVIGEHDLSLMLLAPDAGTLNKNVALARSALSNLGFKAIVEDACNEAAYFARLPGVFDMRVRPAPITSRNLVGFSSFHNYPSGRQDGNQWGPALTLLKSTSGTPFYFNFHLPPGGRKSVDEENQDDRVAGHTMILGPTGAGKTVVQCFMLAQAEKYKPTVFTFDKDQGQEIAIKAFGGQYWTLKNGEPSGFNPCAMPDTPENRSALTGIVKRCIRGENPNYEFSPARERELSEAIDGLYGMDFGHRNLSSLIQFFDRSDPDGNFHRLAKWTRRENGSLAWLLDNEVDRLSLSGNRHFGFDVTAFLENDETRTVVVQYLFHRMEQLIDGRRFILNMDEFWRLLMDPYFSKKALDAVKTYRKRNAIGVFGTQSPSDVLKSPISAPLIEQCVSQVYLPAPKASREDYIDGFKLTEREFDIIKREMPEKSLRGFLFKQGMDSCVCELNLRGFDDELAVLSGTAASVEVANAAIAKAGPDPEEWLPVFHDMRKSL